MTSVDWQHGQVTSISDLSRVISGSLPKAPVELALLESANRLGQALSHHGLSYRL